MFQRFQRGWGIAKASWSVLKLHPKLLVLPALSLVAFLALFGAIAASVYAGGLDPHNRYLPTALERVNLNDPSTYVVFFGFYFACALIGIFFNAALVFCTLEALAGRTPSLRAGLATAVGRLPQILAWALVASTVGLALNMLQSALRDRLGFLGSLLGGLLEVAWAVVTYFVVPVLVVDGVGPIEAISRSSAILKRTWGEAIAGEGGLGLIAFLLMLPAALVLAVGTAGTAASPPIFLAVVLPLVILYVLTLSLVFGTLGAIFRTGTYVYATTGQAPSSIDAALLQGAFRTK
jgi:Family of unknown function (DUF6159)